MAEGILVQFYTIAKKVNSTALPSGTVTEQRCSVNRPCSIERPVIVLRNGGGVPGWNYCRIPGFAGRYYWIENWTYEDNCWSGECKVDVLATYRSTIIHSNYYFLRSSTSYDGDVIDFLYPAKATPITSRINIGKGLNPIAELGMNAGFYVCGIVGTEGLTSFYAFTPPFFKKFCNAIFSNIDWAESDGQQISNSLLKCLFNPFQYITSCIWVPVGGLGAGATSVDKIEFGFWKVDVTAAKLGPHPFTTRSFEVPIQNHNQIARGSYLNRAPFRQIKLEIEPFGSFELDGGKIGSDSHVTANITTDAMTGIAYLRVNTIGESSIPLYTGFAMVGVPVQISDVTTNWIEATGNVVSSIVSSFTGNFMGALQGIGNSFSSLLPEVHTQGANGTLLTISNVPVVSFTFYQLPDEDRWDNGRPLMKNGVMQALGTGYYVVENGATPITGATSSESDMVKNYLESGVYYQ